MYILYNVLILCLETKYQNNTFERIKLTTKIKGDQYFIFILYIYSILYF